MRISVGVISIFLKVCTLYARLFVHAYVRHIHICISHTYTNIHRCVHIYNILIHTHSHHIPNTYTIFFFSFVEKKNRRNVTAVVGVMLVARIFLVNRCRNKVQAIRRRVIRSIIWIDNMHKSRLMLSTCLIVDDYPCLIMEIQDRRVRVYLKLRFQ